MKVTITAESSLTISQCGKTVNIVKGDSFVLYGKVFAYKGIIIDVTKYLYVFSVKTEPGLPPIPTYEFIDNVTIAQNGKVARFTKGQQFKTVSDVVWIADIVLDLTVYAYALTVVSETPVPPEPTGFKVTVEDANLLTFTPAMPASFPAGSNFSSVITINDPGYVLNNVQLFKDGVPGPPTFLPGNTNDGFRLELTDIQSNYRIANNKSPRNYSVTVDNQTVTLNPVINNGRADYKSKINTTITPKAGYKLVSAKIDTTVLTVENNQAVIKDFVMPAKNIVISCVTEDNTVNITGTGTNVTFEPTLPAKVTKGEQTQVKINAATDMVLTSVMVDGEVLFGFVPNKVAQTTATLTPTKNVNIVAEAKKVFTVTAENPNGSADFPATILAGETLTGRVTASEDYRLVSVKVGETSFPVIDESYADVTVNNVQSDIVVDIQTEYKVFTISTDSTEIESTESLPTECPYGQSFSTEITAKTGRTLKSVSFGPVGGEQVTAPVANGKATVNIASVKSDYEISAVTEAIEYEITANGENFDASPTLPATVAHGANFTTLITPTSGFELTNVQAGSEVIEVGDGTSCTVDLTNVTEDIVITIVTSPATRALDDEVQLP